MGTMVYTGEMRNRQVHVYTRDVSRDTPKEEVNYGGYDRWDEGKHG